MNINTLIKKLANTVSPEASASGEVQTKPLMEEATNNPNAMQLRHIRTQPNPYINQTMKNYQVTMGGNNGNKLNKGIRNKNIIQGLQNNSGAIKTPLATKKPDNNIFNAANKILGKVATDVTPEKPVTTHSLEGKSRLEMTIELLKKLFNNIEEKE